MNSVLSEQSNLIHEKKNIEIYFSVKFFKLEQLLNEFQIGNGNLKIILRSSKTINDMLTVIFTIKNQIPRKQFYVLFN